MSASTSLSPIDVAQIQLGSPILQSGSPGSLQRGVNLLNHVYSKTQPTILCWPQGDNSSASPFIKTDTASAWVDWLVLSTHIPADFTQISLQVRSARTTGNTTQIRLSSSVDAGMAAATTITPNTAGALTPTVLQASSTITPGDNTITLQVKGNSVGSAAVYCLVAALDSFAI